MLCLDLRRFALAGFLSRVSSPVVSALVIGMKRALDPNNVLAARNHQLAAESVLF